MVSVTICATKGYTYAILPLARRLQASILLSGLIPHEDSISVILSGDESAECRQAHEVLKESMPTLRHHLLVNKITDDTKTYKNQAQLHIAQLRSAAFAKARSIGSTYCLSMDCDVLPPSNAIRCMMDMLRFDGGYYSVATCPYPSQGGGNFLFGRGTPTQQILPDIFEDERNIPEDLRALIEEKRERLKQITSGPHTPELETEAASLQKALDLMKGHVDRCAPKGNVWELNAKQWRRRGWGDVSYPAIGYGAVVPTDWCGFGCTMMNSKALSLAHFDGYNGGGTEDLWVVWNQWHPHGIKICSILHCACDHVVRALNDQKKLILLKGAYETEGEAQGHLRIRRCSYYSQKPGEQFDESNDGNLGTPKDELKPLSDILKEVESASPGDPTSNKNSSS